MESTGDTSSCSTAANTTDCLLDRLINIVSEKFAADDGKTDWDPITFAFTVPVGIFGILATLLALVAIIQGIFAASPGRRKSSHQVIGKWAERTVTHVSLRELRTYTQASTPRLISDRLSRLLLEMEDRATIGNNGATTAVDQDEDGLLKTADDNENNLRRVGRVIASWLGEFQLLARRLPVCSNRIFSALVAVLQTSSMPSAEAGWLQLLHQFKLEDLPLNTDDTVVTAADYLPDDLKAVPAYADIRTIVVLAAVGGVVSFEPEIGSSYPLLIAPTFAIEFRQHPALGRVAAFSGNVRPKPSQRELIQAFRHSGGYIEAHRDFVHGLKSGTNWFRIFLSDFSVSGYNKAALHGWGTQEKTCDESLICHEIFQIQSHSGQDSSVHWLFVAKTPENPPAAFPADQLPSSIDLVLLCLQSRFWISDKSSQSADRFSSFMSKVTLNYHLENDDGEEVAKIEQVAKIKELVAYVTDGLFLSDVFPICVDFIHGDGQVPLVKPLQKKFFLFILQALDARLDLVRDTLARSRCLPTTLYKTTVMLLAFQKEGNEESVEPSKEASPDWDMDNAQAPVTSLIRNNLSLLTSLDRFLGKEYRDEYHDPTNEKYGLLGLGHRERLRKVVDQCKTMYQGANDDQELTAEDMVAELYILRAILISMTFRSAPDISTLRQSPIWGHVVPVL